MAYNLKAILEAEVIDKLIAVMVAGDKDLEAKIAGLGTKVGSSDTYAGLPTVDQNGKAITVGDTATLTQTDGAHPAGLYEYDGNSYVLSIDYDALDVSSIVEDAKALDADVVAGTVVNDKFTTPKQVATLVAAQVLAEQTANALLYHPKGGEASLKVVGADADAGTQEFVTAKQMEATFTVAEVQAKYDAL